MQREAVEYAKLHNISFSSFYAVNEPQTEFMSIIHTNMETVVNIAVNLFGRLPPEGQEMFFNKLDADLPEPPSFTPPPPPQPTINIHIHERDSKKSTRTSARKTPGRGKSAGGKK